ncbi:type II toxin-antitoxin system PrlF family antitoxin [Mesorhizobium sp. YR577]|uniref:type II toxin-antitoxin system PrlF family antitoxin n=1 Tax=Mesorhizobium sp. YR577 TaxID=1884373 RepID=UPI0008E59FEB|nr:type II toxin-antitoxin system PrlF family antitoxin [Mesorhizobium sp. YR577]SFT48456.1 antitoxin PrlF [Mesorhizobium sp. YR577]
MTALFKEVSTITAKGQTTVPKSVRQVLGVDYGGQIVFSVDEHGVSVQRADTEESDPAIDSFLAFLARDIEKNPQALAGLAPALVDRIAGLTKGMTVDLESPIDGEIDL